MYAEAPSEPPVCPSSFVRLVVFELVAQERRNQGLVDGALNENHDDKAKDGVGSIPWFQKPLYLKKKKTENTIL